MDQAITLCSEMHNIKDAIYENKSKLEGIGEDYQIQVTLTFVTLIGNFSSSSFLLLLKKACVRQQSKPDV